MVLILAPGGAHPMDCRVHLVLADWPTVGVAKVETCQYSFRDGDPCRRRHRSGLRGRILDVLPAAVGPVAASCRLSQPHEVAFPETHIFSHPVARVGLPTVLARGAWGSSLPWSFSTSFTVSLPIRAHELCSSLSRRIWGSREVLRLITKGSPVAVPVVVHRGEHRVTDSACVGCLQKILLLMSASHRRREHIFEILVVAQLRRRIARMRRGVVDTPDRGEGHSVDEPSLLESSGVSR